MKRVLILLALMLLTPPAQAAQLPSGVVVAKAGDLETDCVLAVVVSDVKNRTFSPAEREAAQYCIGYFSSLNDMLMSLRDGNIQPFNICYPPAAVPPIVPVKVFIAFVNAHRDARASYAMPVALAALADAFPCEKVRPR